MFGKNNKITVSDKLASLLRQAMAAKNTSLADLAKAVGTSRTTIANYKKSYYCKRLDFYEKLFKAIGYELVMNISIKEIKP